MLLNAPYFTSLVRWLDKRGAAAASADGAGPKSRWGLPARSSGRKALIAQIRRLEEEGDFSAAWERASAALSTSPRELYLRANVLRLASRIYRPAEALVVLEETGDAVFEEPRLLRPAIQLLSRLGREREAQELARRAVELGSSDA